MTTRCAIYTRKSSEEGLDMAFNSLEAQREAGVDYVKSQRHEGWVAIETRYDDGGYSGGTTDRPSLRSLMADIERGRVDVVLVYKVDRLSRSLADFARLMQTFDEHKVSFVSVTQQFNTTTSMGRLTLNMLLSFAQFEREVAGERIRDKIAATKRKGVWVCGQPPLGYRVEGTDADRGLRVVPEEADVVRAIFTGYAESGSLVALVAQLRAKGCTTKRWRSSRGVWHGGKPLVATTLYRTLTNPLYIGQIAHTRAGKTEVYPGLHEPIIDRALWDRVQARMATGPKDPKHRRSNTHLLAGKIRTVEGYAMSPSSVQRPDPKAGASAPKRRVGYYVSQKAIKQGYRSCPVRAVNAAALDQVVRGAMLRHLAQAYGVRVSGLDAAARDRLVLAVLDLVTVAPEGLTVALDPSRASVSGGSHSRIGRVPADASEPPLDRDTPAVTVHRNGTMDILTVPMPMKALGRRAVLRGPDGSALDPSDAAGVRNDSVTHAIGLAYLWHREMLTEGTSVEAIARRDGLSAAHVHRLIGLTHLSPDLLRAALHPTYGSRMLLADVLPLAVTPSWQRQRQRQERTQQS